MPVSHGSKFVFKVNSSKSFSKRNTVRAEFDKQEARFEIELDGALLHCDNARIRSPDNSERHLTVRRNAPLYGSFTLNHNLYGEFASRLGGIATALYVISTYGVK